MVVAVVTADGRPCVARGWGLTVPEVDGDLVRLLVPSDDTPLHAGLAGGRPVAVTAGCVRTYRALQLKGRSRGVEQPTHADELRAKEYVDAFFDALGEVSAMPRAQCDRFVPVGFVACDIQVEELYDQTPGPLAGMGVAGMGAVTWSR